MELKLLDRKEKGRSRGTWELDASWRRWSAAMEDAARARLGVEFGVTSALQEGRRHQGGGGAYCLLGGDIGGR